jgi:predicted RNase H-like HicB family nuclease
MLTEYIDAAMSHATYEWLPNDRIWYGEIPDLKGVWASGDSEEATRTELREVLEDWLLIGLRLGHEIPPVDGISLNVATPA